MVDMHAVPHRCKKASIAIRVASSSDLDAICDIDDDATRLYASAGLRLDLPPEHEFCIAERRHWSQCLAAGTALLTAELEWQRRWLPLPNERIVMYKALA